MSKSISDQVAAYERVRDDYVSLASALKTLLESLCLANNVNFHVVEARAKTVESFRDKISRPEKRYSNPLTDIQDLCGCRIICYFTEDVDLAFDIVSSEFDVVTVENGHEPQNLSYDQFGYISRHVILRVGQKRNSLTEWRSFSDFEFEVQIRTVVQHAWSAVSHLVKYEQESDIPSALQRRLHRLAGLFELADDEFGEIRHQRSVLRSNAEHSIANGDKGIRLTVESLSALLSTYPEAKNIIDDATSVGFTVDDELWLDESSVADMAIISSRLGIETLDEFESSIKCEYKEYFNRLISPRGEKTAWVASLAFLVLLILIKSHVHKISEEDLVRIGFAEDIAEQVIAAAKQ